MEGGFFTGATLQVHAVWPHSRRIQYQSRVQVTSETSDEYVFKVPTLRNIELAAPYFQPGKPWGLKQAGAAMSTAQLGGHSST
jgi:cytochrome c peroxidase